jgi:hypothetical protein
MSCRYSPLGTLILIFYASTVPYLTFLFIYNNLLINKKKKKVNGSPDLVIVPNNFRFQIISSFFNLKNIIFVSWQSHYIRRKLLKVYILFNCANKIFSSYGTSLHGKTLAGYLSFPFIYLKKKRKKVSFGGLFF